MTVFVRHAQSEFNAFGSKERDCGITELGKEQAKLLKGSYDLVVISPLKRVYETLAYSNIQYKNLLVSHLCREHIDGEQCNLLHGETIKLETKEDLQRRAEKFKEFLRTLEKGNVLVISHYCFLKELLGIGLRNCQSADSQIF